MRASSLLACVLAVVACLFPGCGHSTEAADPVGPDRGVGSVGLSLEIRDGSTVDEVSYSITRGEEVVDTGVIDTSETGPTTPIQVSGLEAGARYTVTFTATSDDGAVSCDGSADFEVETGAVTDLYVYLGCTREATIGGLRPDGSANFCAQVDQVVVSPSTAEVGDEVALSVTARDTEGDPVEFRWSALGGSVSNARARNTTYPCTEPGSFLVAASVSDDPQCWDSWEVTVTCVAGDGGECSVDGDCHGVFPVPHCRLPTTCEYGYCVRGEPLPEGTGCLRGGLCNDAGECRYRPCQSDSDCQVRRGVDECREGSTCESDPLDLDHSYCREGRPLPAGTPCSAGGCDGFGSCIGSGNAVKSEVVFNACKNSISADPSFLPSLLTVRPPPVWKADPTETDTWRIGGEARFDTEFLDAAQAVIPGGVSVSLLHDLKWTVQVRSGATMEDVVLRPVEIPYSCENDQNVLCDPENDLPDGSGNTGCLPIREDNRCKRFMPLPVSTDCAPGGYCLSAGAAPANQCAANGFCISDVLRVPLEEQEVEVTPFGGNITFTWYETSDRGFNDDGTLVIPTAVFGEPTGPIGFRVEVSGIGVGLECMGGGNAGWSLEGPWPVFDNQLLQYFVPFVGP